MNLVVRQISRFNPALLPPGISESGGLDTATVPANEKRDLLARVLSTAGAAAILDMGQGVRGGTFDPIWQAASKAQSPLHLVKGWRRMESYAHSVNRAEMTPDGERFIRFRRYMVGSAKVPSAAENLLICGIAIALLEEVGCRGLRCTMPLGNGGDFVIYRNGATHVPEMIGDTLETSNWSIEWQDFEATWSERDMVFETSILDLAPTCSAKSRKSVEAAAQLLTVDFVRQWKVGELALELGQSTRSFQRHLESANISFSRLIRYLRVQEACRLMEAGVETLAAVGYCSGFSDSSHFSRDFRVSMGMTPTVFKEALVET